jgi:eukaryotic-like serine/threonine-protein kinase
MNTARWQIITDIVTECLELPQHERGTHARLRCAHDIALLGDVLDWIGEAERTQGFLVDATFATPITMARLADDVVEFAEKNHATTRSETEWIGKRLGAYRIVEEIARGGMGSVFKAIRDDAEYDKVVAIKLIRSNLATNIIAQRFRAERQILAHLDHPHIARLIDGGSGDMGESSTSTDRFPYLVMEFVDGIPIDRYCDEKSLGVRERLRHFIHVCAAVHFAHQRLVVHRDLKPSNILVDRNDQVKLLDFGIAKLLDPSALDARGNALASPTEVNAMTPAYASPEQIKGEAITTGSDVYALGVLLYRLLTGASPYRHDTKKPLELAKEIVDTDPQKPSTVVGITHSPRPTEGSIDNDNVVRTLDRKRLRRELKGDLDNIVLMALRKEPARRYASAQQMAEDIERALRNLPVIARADTLAYRAKKFVQRNAIGVAAMATAAIALATTTGYALHHADQARAAQARSEKLFASVRAFANKIQGEALEAIADIPGTAKAQTIVLNASLDYLKQLSAEVGNNRALAGSIAQGLINLAYSQERALQPLQTRRETLQAALLLIENATNVVLAPAEHLRYLIVIKTRLAIIDGEENKQNEARTLFEEAVVLARRNTGKSESFRLTDARAEALMEYGRAPGIEPSIEKRLAMLNEAKAMIENVDRSGLKGDELHDADIKLATILAYLSIAENDRVGPQAIDTSITHALAAIRLLEKLRESSPNQIRVLGNLSFVSGHLADAYGKKSDFDKARTYFRKANEHLETLLRRDPTQSQLNINYLVGRLQALENELRAQSSPAQLLELLAKIESDIGALPDSTRTERAGLGLTAWLNTLTAEAKFRVARSGGLSRVARIALLSDAETRFRSAKLFVGQHPELVDANSPEIVELLNSGAERTTAEIAKLR